MNVNSLFVSSEHLTSDILSRKESLGLYLMLKIVLEIMFDSFPLPTVLL